MSAFPEDSQYYDIDPETLNTLVVKGQITTASLGNGEGEALGTWDTTVYPREYLEKLEAYYIVPEYGYEPASQVMQYKDRFPQLFNLCLGWYPWQQCIRPRGSEGSLLSYGRRSMKKLIKYLIITVALLCTLTTIMASSNFIDVFYWDGTKDGGGTSYKKSGANDTPDPAPTVNPLTTTTYNDNEVYSEDEITYYDIDLSGVKASATRATVRNNIGVSF